MPFLKPLADGINSWTLGGVPVILPSGQLSGSPCQTQVLVNRAFATTCACTYQHYYATLHRTRSHVNAHVCTMRLYTSLAYTSTG